MTLVERLKGKIQSCEFIELLSFWGMVIVPLFSVAYVVGEPTKDALIVLGLAGFVTGLLWVIYSEAKESIVLCRDSIKEIQSLKN